jgi:biopolymer transport protein ExbD
MAEVVQSGGSRGKKGKKHRARRAGVRMDMTPMVDVAFLLLTFFMLSTTLTTPQVMEISLPPDSKTVVEVAESNVMTLRVRKDESIFWNIGANAPARIANDALKTMLAQRLKENPKMATLIKIDRDAPYQTLVDMLDELNMAQAMLGQSEKRFSLVTMDEADRALVQAL